MPKIVKNSIKKAEAKGAKTMKAAPKASASKKSTGIKKPAKAQRSVKKVK